MIRKTIKKTFSVNGVNDLKKMLESMRDNVPTLKRYFVMYSLDYLEEKAKGYIESSIGHGSYIPTGNLMNSFKKYYDIGELVNDAYTTTLSGHGVYYAAMVEYGTGTYNNPTESNGYYKSKDAWSYLYMNDNGEVKRAYTNGIPPHRFMYNSITDYIISGKDICFEKAFRKVYGGILK